MSSLPLFSNAATAAFKTAFEGWLDDQLANGFLRRPGSVQVYRDMWGAFAGWCLGQSPTVTLASLDASDLQAFQMARFGMKSVDLSLSPRHALRLMRLIDRVLQHHGAALDSPPNRAAAQWLSDHPAVRYAEASNALPLPEFLSISESKDLITFLSRPGPGRAFPRR